MKPLAAAVVFVLFVGVSVRGQAAKPTVPQCQAHVKTWAAEFPAPVGIRTLAFQELERRNKELLDCGLVDTANTARYAELRVFYLSDLLYREDRYLERHGLRQQFLNEDAAGVR